MNKETKICGNCKAELSKDSTFCPVCGKTYTPLICDNCQSEIITSTKFCPSCGFKIKSTRQKKTKKIITIVSIATAAALIITLCLVLFIPYETYRDCYRCDLGWTECDAKYYAEVYYGGSLGSHDCDLCVNGKMRCPSCSGSGGHYEMTTNFQEWF